MLFEVLLHWSLLTLRLSTKLINLSRWPISLKNSASSTTKEILLSLQLISVLALINQGIPSSNCSSVISIKFETALIFPRGMRGRAIIPYTNWRKSRVPPLPFAAYTSVCLQISTNNIYTWEVVTWVVWCQYLTLFRSVSFCRSLLQLEFGLW